MPVGHASPGLHLGWVFVQGCLWTLSSQVTCVPGFPRAEITPEYFIESQTPGLSPDPNPLPPDTSPKTCLYQETTRFS